MIELIDNATQFAATFIALIGASVLFYKKRKLPLFLISCFYGTFTLGTLYWTLHMLLTQQTPQIFYVSELAWSAGYVFLLAMQYALSTREERRTCPAVAWLVPVVCVPQFMLYMTRGELFSNLMMCGLTMVLGWSAVRGLVFSAAHKEEAGGVRAFHVTVLVFVGVEYALWTCSCLFEGDSLANPYFWCDFLMTLTMLALLPATQKAVAS